MARNDPEDGKSLQNYDVHPRALEERSHGRRVSVLGQPDVYETKRTRAMRWEKISGIGFKESTLAEHFKNPEI